MYDAVAIGELLIDFASVSADADGYPVMAAHPGGAPANYLAAMAAYGKKTAFIGKVGTDTFGNLLVNTLESAGIETKGIIRDDRYFTTLAFVTFDSTGDRSFSFSRKPGADTMLSFDEVDLSLLDTRVLHFGTLSLTDEPSRSATYRLLDAAKERGCIISLDPNLRKPLWSSEETAKEQMLLALSKADVVKISDDEVDFLWQLSPEEGAEKILSEFGAKLVFVTCGADGAVYAGRNGKGRVPGLSGLKVIDTTGAGDIFGGTAMAALLDSGKNPEELSADEMAYIARKACITASLSTTAPGGIGSIPSVETVDSYLK